MVLPCCQDHDKGGTQKEMPVAWDNMKDIKQSRKSLKSAYEKIVG